MLVLVQVDAGKSLADEDAEEFLGHGVRLLDAALEHCRVMSY